MIDYMMDRKPNDRFDLRVLFDTPRDPLEENSNPMEDILEIITSSLLDCWSKDLLKKKELIMRKYFHQLLFLSLFEFSCPLRHILIMKFGKWISRLPF